jgi:ribosome recycling factor
MFLDSSVTSLYTVCVYYRKELCKEAKSLGEEGKVAVRNIRRDTVDAIKKAEKVSYFEYYQWQ